MLLALKEEEMESQNRALLSERIKIRLTEEQRKLLIIRTEKAGVTVSEYMRSQLCKNQIIVPSAHMDTARRIREIGARLKLVFDELKQSGTSLELKLEHDKKLSELTELLERINSLYRKQ